MPTRYEDWRVPNATDLSLAVPGTLADVYAAVLALLLVGLVTGVVLLTTGVAVTATSMAVLGALGAATLVLGGKFAAASR